MTDVATPDGWAREGDALVKTFEFATFAAAIGFMSEAAPRIDEMNHHPTWTNTYDRVRVELSSHDAGTVTERDVRLAAMLDEIAGSSEPGEKPA